MNLQVSFDFTDLEKAIEIAKRIEPYVDIIEIGSMLIYQYGSAAIKTFREQLPESTLLADAKVIDRGKESATILLGAGANWVTVMAGTGKNVIHAACTTAHGFNKKVMLDIIDASSPGQSALEAKNLGADAILFHQPFDEEDPLSFLDKWDMVRGNTNLPIYISAKITRDTLEKIIPLKPDGIIVGRTITQAEDPAQEAKYFYDVCKNK